jgi:3-hydroxy-9,10-secoandrosta-1,3,5(10)-triene-9,17-dione monooxygenase reductase component
MISTDEFRETVGRFATGVTVITTRDEEGSPMGFTANAFASFSLDPPSVLVSVDENIDTYPLLRREEVVFAVNILAEHQEELAQTFASKGGSEKFESVEHHEETTSAPIFDDVLAFLECRAVEKFDRGDHMILIGEVLNMAVDEDAEPLLFYRGDLSSLHA